MPLTRTGSFFGLVSDGGRQAVGTLAGTFRWVTGRGQWHQQIRQFLFQVFALIYTFSVLTKPQK